jgi:hypothetical protein
MVDIPPLPGTGPSRTQSAAAEMSSGMRDATELMADAVETGQRPGLPLDVVSRVAREAPLSSLFIAFLLGVAFARR